MPEVEIYKETLRHLGYEPMMASIEDGTIDTRPWITHRTGFDMMIGEFPNWLKPETGVIKAMVALP